jgi:hypothetical protein
LLVSFVAAGVVDTLADFFTAFVSTFDDESK